MTWELYEVWAVDEAGHEQLIETTKSQKEAMELAERTLDEGFTETVIYRETEDGDLEEFQRFVLD